MSTKVPHRIKHFFPIIYKFEKLKISTGKKIMKNLRFKLVKRVFLSKQIK